MSGALTRGSFLLCRPGSGEAKRFVADATEPEVEASDGGTIT